MIFGSHAITDCWLFRARKGKCFCINVLSRRGGAPAAAMVGSRSPARQWGL